MFMEAYETIPSPRLRGTIVSIVPHAYTSSTYSLPVARWVCTIEGPMIPQARIEPP